MRRAVPQSTVLSTTTSVRMMPVCPMSGCVTETMTVGTTVMSQSPAHPHTGTAHRECSNAAMEGVYLEPGSVTEMLIVQNTMRMKIKINAVRSS